MTKLQLVALLLAVSLLFVFCKKEDQITNPIVVGNLVDTSGAPPSLEVSFSAYANNLPLVADSQWYKNTSNDYFTISKFNYYISNVKMKREDGLVFTESNSYHLVKHIGGKTSFTITNLPPGNYSSIEFLIGVDSAMGVSGVHNGDLDVANDMFWDWSTGYLFFKLEGAYMSTDIPDPGSFYSMHIGGFQSGSSCLQKAAFTFSTAVVAKKGRQSSLRYKVMVDEIFMNPMKIGFDYYYKEVVKGPKIFSDISANYKDMFVVDKIVN
ncbi:MAG: hypothetical protein PSX36_07485 [bacterium]|nr:hypothetical protein [bacterium]